MNNLKREIIENTLSLYKYLEIYGVDRHNTREDISLLILIQDILENNCYYNLLDNISFSNIVKVIEHTLHSNPKLKYCRIDITDYKNLGGVQNINTFQIIKLDG
jgi:methylmalonyl-CoA mutase N-terminal domain/subunit